MMKSRFAIIAAMLLLTAIVKAQGWTSVQAVGVLPTNTAAQNRQALQQAIDAMSERERAQHFAYIPQAHTPPFPFKVSDVVILGRTPYLSGAVTTAKTRDQVIAYKAMQLLSIEHLADQVYTELSGGQQQLVLIARALAQEPDLLVMDEPTASLDFGNQQLVLSCVYRLSRMGMSVLMVTHDPDHALFCSDRVIMMEAGCVIGDGTPDEIITTENLRRIYGTESYVTDVRVESGETVRVCVPVIRTDAREVLAGVASARTPKALGKNGRGV